MHILYIWLSLASNMSWNYFTPILQGLYHGISLSNLGPEHGTLSHPSWTWWITRGIHQSAACRYPRPWQDSEESSGWGVLQQWHPSGVRIWRPGGLWWVTWSSEDWKDLGCQAVMPVFISFNMSTSMCTGNLTVSIWMHLVTKVLMEKKKPVSRHHVRSKKDRAKHVEVL